MSHFPNKFSILTIFALFIVAGTIIFVGVQQSSGEFKKDLELSIANTIIKDQINLAKKGYPSPDGSIIVRVQPEASDLQPHLWRDTPPVSIWKYEDGILKLAADVDLDQIKIEGNAYNFVFIIQKIEGDKAFVDIVTHYPYVYSDTWGFYKGGNATHCIFEYINKNWFQKTKKLYYNWD